MRNPADVLREKENELQNLHRDIEALRLAIRLCSENGDADRHFETPSQRIETPSARVEPSPRVETTSPRMESTVSSNPKPVRAASMDNEKAVKQFP